MMYRHRPSTPALVAALVIFIGGTICVFSLKPQHDAGEIEVASLILLGCVTSTLSGALVITAFARYKFIHLWKSTGAAHSDKYKHPHKHRKHRRRSRH